MTSTTLFTTPPPPSTTSAAPVDKDNLALLIDNSKSTHHLLQIHAALLRRGLHHHPILNFKLQRSYASLGHLHHSVTLFHRTPNPNVFLWTHIINAHAHFDLFHHALSYYSQMLTHPIQPNAFTLSSLLKACTLHPARAVHSHAIKFGLSSHLYVSTGLVDAYARGGDVASAQKLFDAMPERSLVSYTAMLTCYAKHGMLPEARVLFEGMGMKDVVCWNVMIDGYAQHGCPNEALVVMVLLLILG